MEERKVSNFFEIYAGEFDSIYGGRRSWPKRLIDRIFRKSMRLRFIRTIDGCQPIEGRTVLDVGCGPGHYSLALAQRGASEICGIDFAGNMIELARQKAAILSVDNQCRFISDNFMTHRFDKKYDYAVIMGFMDYMREPGPIIEKTLALTISRAFFSFPASGGLLAWQREIRYRKRCELFLYRKEQIAEMFQNVGCTRVEIERISRDYFVTAYR